ncbi:MAG: hypothetical protein Q7S29_01870 [Candidatus Peribacter sp.]|nr:hypothetical protein [Candidatus Peribacter sp.]
MGNILPIRTGNGPDDPLAYEHPDDVPTTVQLQSHADGSYSVLPKPGEPAAAQDYVASLRERVALVCDAPIS